MRQFKNEFSEGTHELLGRYDIPIVNLTNEDVKQEIMNADRLL